MRDPKERLHDILDAIESVRRYAARGRDAFDQDELIQGWFVQHLQIMGEAANEIPKEVRDLAPEIPWSKVIGMRHVLVHRYFGIDRDAVWDAAQQDLPTLADQLASLLRRLDSSP